MILAVIFITILYPLGDPISAQTLHCPGFAVLHIRLHPRQLVFALTSGRK